MKNHYQTLGVSKSASQEEIKAAYRKLAMQHHPDRGGDAEEFKAINTAYSILSDPTNKEVYDRSTNQRRGPSPFDHDWADVFRDFHRDPPTTIKTVAVEVPLVNVIHGCAFDIDLHGKSIRVSVPKMFADGDKIIMPGMAASVFGSPFTDLHVVIRWAIPYGLEIRGLDVIMAKPISVLALLFGGSVQVEPLHGGTIELAIQAKSSMNTTLRVVGSGLHANNGERGNLFIRLIPEMPNDEDEQYRKIKELLV